VIALTTIQYHRRSRDVLVARYRASKSRARKNVPRDVVPFRVRGAGEVMFWLPEVRALVPGDRLVADEGGLTLCHESWIRHRGLSHRDLATLLRPLLELPIEMILVSHGEPVLRRGRSELQRVLDRHR
jgi:hypothetical protein